ncbi:hypothetical protein B0H16DRAFT_41037 [Mycena metata]|uniref:RING-type domain-containing protein n=1 Tax=Mycena metata TaxID=1033252 RepID=A0AAD7NTI7_9AGAR|nr:hypothetical protein B0H16DRAFT_41037 [Mycena metata]
MRTLEEEVPDSEDDTAQVAIEPTFDKPGEHGLKLAYMLEAEHHRALSELKANNRALGGRGTDTHYKINTLHRELESHTRRSRNAIKTVLRRNNALSSRNSELILTAGRRRTEIKELKLAIASVEKESMNLTIQLRELRDAKSESMQVQERVNNSVLDSAKCPIYLSTMWTPDTIPKCSHTFCQCCLISWFWVIKQRRSNKYTCPGCRTRIKSQPVRNRALESLIETLADAGIVEGDIAEPIADAYTKFFKQIG